MGSPGWVAALTPFSVDGMIVAALASITSAARPTPVSNNGRLPARPPGRTADPYRCLPFGGEPISGQFG